MKRSTNFLLRAAAIAVLFSAWLLAADHCCAQTRFVQPTEGLPQQSYSSPKFDFAPPANPNNRQRINYQFNDPGNGLSEIGPRINQPGQIGSFVTPLNESSIIQIESGTEPGNRDGLGREQIETSGRVETIRERYPDGKVQIARQVTQDEDRNYFNHGTWQLFSRQGEVMARGNFALGRMDGLWQRWHPSNGDGLFGTAPFNQFQGPFQSIAQFSNGKLDGVWTITDKSKNTVFEMPYREGIRNGTATWYYPSGQKYRECAFNDGVLEGVLVEWDKQQKVTRREEYIAGRKVDSDVQMLGQKQKLSEAFYLNAKLVLEQDDDWWRAEPATFASKGERVQHGPVGQWYQNGQPKMQGTFREGLRDGRFLGWHENGQKNVDGIFQKDMPVGIWTWWHTNGFKKIEGAYADGKPSGEWVWWDENGSVRNRKDFSQQPEPKPPIKDGSDSNTDADPKDLPAPNNAAPEEIIGVEVQPQELPEQSPGPFDIPDEVIPHNSQKPPIRPTQPAEISDDDPFEGSQPEQRFQPLERSPERKDNFIESEFIDGEFVEGEPIEEPEDADWLEKATEPSFDSNPREGELRDFIPDEPKKSPEPIEDPFGDIVNEI